MTEVHAIWIGDRIDRIHRACLQSFINNGYALVLHCYRRPSGAPEKALISDAASLLPESDIIAHSAVGSTAIFSDLLRYELLSKYENALYVDCDVFCLREFQSTDYICGWETFQTVNSAVLRLPTRSPVLDSLRQLKSVKRFIPPWATNKRQAYYRWRSRAGFPVKLQDMPWGFTGPHALTYYLKEHGLESHASPIDVFYPVHYEQTPLFTDPALTLSDLTTDRTTLLHLYANMLRRHVDPEHVPENTALGELMALALT